MPRKTSLRCYFGCTVDGPLHHFPQYKNEHEERFNAWKDVLNPSELENGNKHIHDNLSLCYRHFEDRFKLPSHRLTANAVPTLHLSFIGDNLQYHPDNIPSLAASTSQQMEIDVPVAIQPVDVQIPSISKKDVRITLKQNVINTTVQTGLARKVVLKQLDTLKARILKHKKKCKTQTSKIRMAEKLSKTKSVLQLSEKLPEAAKIFTNLQLKNLKKSPRGRKYTLEEKMLCLTILKQGPKCYNLLKKLFVLPSIRTLQKLLSHIVMQPGINSHIINNLKKTVTKLSEEKKLCSLIFDEVSLSPGLYYSKIFREINGFEHQGFQKTSKIADHALVIMIKSLKGKFKQPLGFTFCQGNTKKEDLKKIITEAIKAITATGLRVVCTVCDQSTTNVATINNLLSDTKNEYLKRGQEYKSSSFEIEGEKIFPIYDPPHLLKGMRNNLLTKDLRFIENGVIKIAKWQHIIQFMEKNEETDELRLVNKLTESHVNRNKIPKMKVKYAAQIFSTQLAAAMKFCTRHGVLPKECDDTADFILKMDQLFDSFNSHSYKDQQKKFKVCLKNNSPHFKLWNELLPVLRSCGFGKRKNDGTLIYEKVPSIKNFIHNIEVYKEMWRHLNIKFKVTSLLTRNINQDPLEIFFCKIRSHGIRNVNPTSEQFINAYKTLIVNNFATPHSVNANCEEDSNSILLQTIEFFQTDNGNAQDKSNIDNNVEINLLLNELWTHDIGEDNESLISNETKRYVTGAIIKKMQTKVFRNCSVCTKQLIDDKKISSSYIYERDYNKKSLIYPTNDFKILVKDMIHIIVQCIQASPESRLLIDTILFYIDIYCNFRIIMSCTLHSELLKKEIISTTINIILHSWCAGVNRILRGKLEYFASNDKIKADAYKYYKTHCKNKKIC